MGKASKIVDRETRKQVNLQQIKMFKVFISWYDGHNHILATEFFELLKKNGFDIEHSPFSPHSGVHDMRWSGWYEEGLPKAMGRVNAFIAVITPSCDSSSWMMQEFESAYFSFMNTGKPKLYFIRFDSIEKPLKYPGYYLQNSDQLSSVPEEAVRTLLASK